MADKMNIDPSAPELPPEAIAFASKMYDAARAGQIDIFQQALLAGLPANMTNEKGDTLVCSVIHVLNTIGIQHSHFPLVRFYHYSGNGGARESNLTDGLSSC